MYNNVDSGSIILAIPKIVTVSKRTESPHNWGNKNCCRIAGVGRVLRKTSNYAAFRALAERGICTYIRRPAQVDPIIPVLLVVELSWIPLRSSKLPVRLFDITRC